MTIKTRWILIALVLQSAAMNLPLAMAQIEGGDFEIRRSSVDNGVQVFSGDGYALQGIMGQPDAGTVTGGSFELTGGFWAPENGDLLFKSSYEG